MAVVLVGLSCLGCRVLSLRVRVKVWDLGPLGFRVGGASKGLGFKALGSRA